MMMMMMIIIIIIVIIIIHPLPKVNERYRTLERYNNFRLTVRPVGFYIAEVSHLLVGPLYEEQNNKVKGAAVGLGLGVGVEGQGSGGLAVYTLLA